MHHWKYLYERGHGAQHCTFWLTRSAALTKTGVECGLQRRLLTSGSAFAKA
jgi:hypothetical protein